MDQPPALQDNGHWRMAVWALRTGFAALTVVLSGLIVLWSGSSPWVLAAGVICWLAAAVVMSTGFLWARHQLPKPWPGFWSMRFMLISDTVHARASGSDHPDEPRRPHVSKR
jgi:hypothetical protein